MLTLGAAWPSSGLAGAMGLGCHPCGRSAAYSELLSLGEGGRTKRTVRTSGCPYPYPYPYPYP